MVQRATVQPAVVPSANTEPAAATRPAAGLPYPRIAPIVLAGWLATILVLGSAVWMGIARRDGVMESWPPSERVYKAFGYRRG